MGNKKVCLFIHHLGEGGAEKITLYLANGIIKKGYNVDIVTFKCKNEIINQISKNAEKQLDPVVKVFTLNATRLITAIIPFAKYLRREKPDIILSALNHVNIGAIISKFFSLTSIPVFVVNHVYYSEYLRSKSGIKPKLVFWIMKFLYPRADGIISVSKTSANDLAKLLRIPENKVKVVYNPVIGDEYYEAGKIEVNHPFFNSPDQAPVIIAAGRLEYPKDFITIMEAIKMLNKKKTVRLLLFGMGPEMENLKQWVVTNNMKGLIDLPGYTNQIPAYLLKVNAFVLSSYYEALPTVIIEALAANCPVISTDCPAGPAEILCNGKYGKLVPVKDAVAMATAINETLENPKIQVPQSYLDKFTVDGATQNYLDLFFRNQKS